jgi:hypothetical protein
VLEKFARNFGLVFLFLISLLSLIQCAQKEPFTQEGTSDFFVQDFNPEFLDILWVVDDRSPLYFIREKLTSEATQFFTRLDSSTRQYRLAFVSGDMAFAKGQLLPRGTPTILTKKTGSLAQRTGAFSSIFSQVINLRTGAENRAFESAVAALKTNFITTPGVPLVIVFISDSDDHSTFTGSDALSYFDSQLLELKGGNRDLLKLYAINYEPLSSPTTPKTSLNRCATLENADIDKPGFEDRYFRLADLFNGEKANLCGTFANSIDLSGIKLKEPKTRFKLSKKPRTSVITVSVVRADGSRVEDASFVYDSSLNEIVFTNAPEEGTSIQVTYSPEQN